MTTTDSVVEEWRPAPGWEAGYSVSSLGRIRRDLATYAKAGHILTPALSAGYGRTRYLQVRLSIDNKARTCRLSSLVAEAFIGPRPVGAEVNHKDGDKTNNTPANLEYTSRRKNEDHAVANGLHAWGESHGMAKLTADAVREIRTRRLGRMEYARKFKVSKGAIDGVLLGKTWRHLDNLPMRERAKGITRSQAERRSQKPQSEKAGEH